MNCQSSIFIFGYAMAEMQIKLMSLFGNNLCHFYLYVKSCILEPPDKTATIQACFKDFFLQFELLDLTLSFPGSNKK